MATAAATIRELKPDAGTGVSQPLEAKPNVVAISDSPRYQPSRISIDALYPDSTGATDVFRTSQRLLATAANYVTESAGLRWTDPVASDDKMSQLFPILLELFCCRELGEGFAAVINGLIHSVRNNASEQWDGTQLKEVASVIDSLRSEPYLNLDQAIAYLDRMERVELVPEPPELDILGDWLDGQSLR